MERRLRAHCELHWGARVESPLRAWLELECQMITGAEAGLVVVGASEHAPAAQVERWPADAPPSARLSTAVASALEQGRLVVQPPGEAAGPMQGTSHLALPLLRDGRVLGAVGLSVHGVPVTELKALAGLLGYGVQTLVMLLEAQSRVERLAARLSVAGSLLDHERLSGAAHALASDLARELGCERVAIGRCRGARVQLVALSSSLRFAADSDLSRGLCAAMQEAIEQDALLELPAVPGAPPDSLAAHEDLLRDTGDGALCTLPLAAHGRAVGALTFEWSRASAIDERTRGRVRDAGLLCGPILALMGRAEAGALERARGALLCWSDRVFGSDRVLAARAAAVAALLLLGLMLVPAPYRVTARATLEGRVQRALVAGVDGYVAEAHARAGDLVHAGDVIARLDDRDLRLERRKRESEKAQLEREYREALAGQDRTQVSILRAQIDQAAAQLDLVDEQLGRTSVVAPFDGIILEGDLDRSLGSPVELGVVLFELAPLDGYRIILEIDGRDIADVAVGQRGRLALAALPGRTQSLVLERITPVSTTEDGRSYFRAEAVLEQPIAALRPGMEGIAKIDAGRRRLLWIWTHGLIDWLRLWAWSFLP